MRRGHFWPSEGFAGVVVPHLLVAVRFLPTSREGSGTMSTGRNPENRTSFQVSLQYVRRWDTAGYTGLSYLPFLEHSGPRVKSGLCEQRADMTSDCCRCHIADRPTSTLLHEAVSLSLLLSRLVLTGVLTATCRQTVTSLPLVMAMRATQTTERCNFRSCVVGMESGTCIREMCFSCEDRTKHDI